MSFAKELLANEDSIDGDAIPEVYKMSQEQKSQHNFMQQALIKYQLEAAGSCIQPCFENMKSPVVSQNESDCMTNTSVTLSR